MSPFATNKLPIGAPPAPPIPLNLKPIEKEKEENLNTNNEFLSELRDFMNDFIGTELGVDANEEVTEITKEQANFYVKLFNEVAKEEKEVEEMCKAEIDRSTRAINEFKDRKLQELAKKKDYFTSILKQFAAAELEGKKTKSIKLPYGTIAFKKQPDKYTYPSDEELVLAMKSINPELIKTKTTESVNKSQLKKEGIVKEGKLYLGEFELPVTVESQENKFEIKTITK